ncbi:MAG: SulP family inorganic anion transporter [Trichodesmium sp. St16_bin4-tuft]|nr:SulP family inorganic anion transporter [Trichodesmium sp. MAG_R01]MDE5068756.1 SulP family inorganic anion transporter [Trichodesmium sp. St4_bin8_1]MDE5078167.1 SulP family inorganic anion transporter [Trichodesmium sp. St2_bin6]MDE5101210.1 SulP family inorganic anion transporter [Trichodesmium sp. St16_bin4-tuft]MDE5101849.1 SulP family inorganic anion transporter [Trichodesmium sp. St19_bin2]
MQLVNSLHFNNLRGDLLGGLTAAIVALPLALAFGVSSGAGAITGLYGAIFVGFFAALCGGTPSQITGPTGPMTVLMATVFTTLLADNPDAGRSMAFTVVMLGGIFQILFGVLQLGKYIVLIPYAVISGFMSGVGVIIIIIQIGPFLGHPASASVAQSIKKIPEFLINLNPAAVGLGILTIVILLFTPRKVTAIIPSPLLALLTGTLISVFFLSDSNLILIGEIPTGLPKLHLPVFTFNQLQNMLVDGLVLGTLGSIDSLLTSLVADNITQTNHDSDHELIGQGIGNIMSGLFGGLPGAGATMRTVVNVHAGGKTPLSGIVHSIILLLILLWAGKLTEAIPQAILAGILLKVGIDIIDWGFLKRAHKLSLKAAGIMYSVLLLTVFVNLVTAVAVGIFIANLFTVKRLSDMQINDIKAIVEPNDEIPLRDQEKQLLKECRGHLLLLHLGGPMSFGAAKALSRHMGMVQQYDVLILDLSDVSYLGITMSLALENMVTEASRKHREVFIVGASGGVKTRLGKLKISNFVPRENLVGTRIKALQQTLTLLVERKKV